MVTFRSHQSRALDVLRDAQKGCIYVPTGGGKTIIMMEDCKRRLQQSSDPLTIVVVAPRILLANQLCSEFVEYIVDASYDVLHVHSGETVYDSSTRPGVISNWVSERRAKSQHQIIFSTYHSLNRIVDSGISINLLYCDEAHNATAKQHFVGVAATSMSADNSFFFTATPKYSRDPYARGMNNRIVFGDTLMTVPAPELVENGSIIPPKLVVHETDHVRTKHNAAEVDRDVVLDILEDLDAEQSAKVLVAAPNTRVLWRMLSNSDILDALKERGYDVLHITSKHGAYVNDQKVGREQFFKTLNEWGRDDSRKFIIFHYSILSEGINVPGLTHTILLRNLPVIEMAQTIGRVIRLHKDDAKDIASGKLVAGQYELYRKSHGVVTVPIHGKQSIATRNRLQKVIDLIFVDGLPAHSFA